MIKLDLFESNFTSLKKEIQSVYMNPYMMKSNLFELNFTSLKLYANPYLRTFNFEFEFDEIDKLQEKFVIDFGL